MYSDDGVFSVTSTRKMLNRFAIPFYPYDWVKWAPKKVNIFGWRGEQDRLATMVGLKKRGILPNSSVCKLCGEREEDADHLFIGCYVAAVLWQKVSSWCNIQQIYAHSMKDLLSFYKTAQLDEHKRSYVQTIILATCWGIWKARNDGIFKGKHVNIDGIFGEMQATTFLWIKNRAKRTNLVWRSWVKFDITN
ncbi:putative reverse transcriptase zinc-binding domain-containing protein [Helianthus anomalus]